MTEGDERYRKTGGREYLSQAEADRAALERLYGSPKKGAKGQWGIGLALVVFGSGLLAWGAADGDAPGLIAVGALAVGVGIWSVFDGILRGRRET